MGTLDTKRFIAILALSFFIFFPWAVLASEQAVGHFESGIASFDRGDYAQALASFQKAVEEKPDFAQAHYNIGIVYDQLERFKDAIEAYKKVLEIDPDTGLVFENLVMDSYMVGNIEDAMYYMKLANSQGKPVSRMLYNQIWTEYTKKAKGTLVVLPGSAPGTPQATKEQLESEIASIEKALQVNESAPDLLLELGVRYRQVGRIDKAIEILKRAQGLNDRNPQVYAELAACYFLDDQQSLFVSHMEKARKLGYRPSDSLRDLQAQSVSQKYFLIPSSALDAPTNLWAVQATSPNKNRIHLTWKDNSTTTNEDGFKIERKRYTDTDYSYLDTVGQNILEYYDSAVTVGDTYCYRIHAYKEAVNSKYSNDACGAVMIDPPDNLQLVAATYLGGTNDTNEHCSRHALAVDGAGYVYLLCQQTDASDFPVTAGAYDTSPNGDFDIAVCKFSSDLKSLLYSTYLGGSGLDAGHAIAVDTKGDVYICGSTKSSNFPTTEGAYSRTLKGGQDAFICKLSLQGAGSSDLIYSTLIGGTYTADDWFSDIAVDSSGYVYATGCTKSTDWPTTPGAYATGSGYAWTDPVICKFDLGGNGSADLLYSAIYGRVDSNGDYGFAITLDAQGYAYTTGFTWSLYFPVTEGACQPTAKAIDMYLCKWNLAGKGDADLVYSTLFGGDGGGTPADEEVSYDVLLDSEGYIYITGKTPSASLPIKPATAYDTTFGGGGLPDGFIAKFDKSPLLGAGSGDLIYSTYLGAGGTDYAMKLAVDSSGFIYLAGFTNSPDFPVTDGAYDSSYNAKQDGYIAKFSLAGNGANDLIYSSFLGGDEDEQAQAIVLDQKGYVYIAGFTGSANFPTIEGSYCTTYNGGGRDIFIAKLGAGEGM